MKSKEQPMDIMTFRHSLSHVLAAVVKEKYPDVKLGIGPATEEGFYYDFLLPEDFSFTSEVLAETETGMRQFIKKNHTFVRKEIDIEQALELFKGEPFKLELINDIKAKHEACVGVYESGPFTDLCKGPHVEQTRELAKISWKLDRVSGAYWKGDEKNAMLQRIYGLAFSTKEELKDYIHRREEAIKRDHRKLGAELELFTFSDLVGKGLPLLLPKGATIRRILERFTVDEEIKRGYQHVSTPPMAKKKLYEISGHWAHYQESMYPPMDISDEEIVLRPMTCPHHFMIYKDKPRSYRDLPLRFAEIASQFRKEKSGELSGLIRVMLFHLADAHIFCRPDQLEEEFKSVIDLINYIMKCLGIESAISFRASFKDDQKEKYVNNMTMWAESEKTLEKILNETGIDFQISKGDAAFYGPKLDVQMRNILGKEETVFTVQIDFSLPGRFDLSYIDASGINVSPVVIHRSSIGCLERTIAFLIEFYGGALPLWISPVQTRIITITERQITFAKELGELMLQEGIRMEMDIRNEKIGKKIREGRLQRIPYLIILGDKEVESRNITVRNRDTQKQKLMPYKDFIENVKNESAAMSLKLGAAE
jgi:threonyl-tRNA synthetase